MTGMAKITVLIILLLLAIVPVTAEVHWIQTNVDGVLVTVSSAAGTVGSGRTSYDGTVGTYAIMMDVPPGMYTVTGEKTGYVTQTESANVVAGWTGTTHIVMTAVTAARGSIVISSDPCSVNIAYSDPSKRVTGSGTTVAIGGEGTIPCYFGVVSVPVGLYEATAQKVGYVTQTQTFTVEENSNGGVAFVLTPSSGEPVVGRVIGSGMAILSVSPPNSQVRICITDPAVSGGSPVCENREYTDVMSLPLTTLQYMEITVSKKGYGSQTAKVTVANGEKRNIPITLVAIESLPSAEPSAPVFLKSGETAVTTTAPPGSGTPLPTTVPARVLTVKQDQPPQLQPTISSIPTVVSPEATRTSAPVITVAPPGGDVIGGLLRFFNGLFGGR